MVLVQYKGEDTDLDLSKYSEVLRYIREHIVPQLLPPSKEDDDTVVYRKITKNDKIKSSVDRIISNVAENRHIVLYSYGMHIQKMLTVIEIAKKSYAQPIQQWNMLLSFSETQTGRNELLEKKKIVPILVTVLQSPIAQADLQSTGFTKQV